MPMDAQEIEALIKAAIPDAEITIRDLAGDRDHYAATVISEVVPRQVPGAAAPDRLSVVAGPDGRRAARVGAADRRSGKLSGPPHSPPVSWRASAKTLLRERKPDQHHRVTYVELFFDLVFVFAITQISHFLLAHFTPARRAADRDPDARGVVGLGLHLLDHQLARPRTDRGPADAVRADGGGAVAVDLDPEGVRQPRPGLRAGVRGDAGRPHRVLRVSIPKSQPELRTAFLRILLWLSISGAFWIAGGLLDGEAQLGLWLVALAIEYTGPVTRFWVPGLGASSTRDWSVEGGHMAERCALFIIIALGESVVVTGATFAEIAWTATTMTAFATALLGSIAMWWVYFHIGVHVGSERISHSSDPGRMARRAYTYLHLPIVAGIVVAAVGDEVLLAHPDGHADIKATVCMIGGPMLFLFGVLLFKQSVRGRWQLSHMVGIAALVALAPFASQLSPLALGAATTAIMLVVGAWEAISLGVADRSPVE